MTTDERYNGWTNRETWAVALHINNDQGWQESVHEALRAHIWEIVAEDEHGIHGAYSRNRAGEIIRENVEEALDLVNLSDEGITFSRELLMVAHEVGSLWRVNWTELGAAFLADLEEQDEEEGLSARTLYVDED